ncbi:hypothetical protein LXL04_038003 [Taraxacum kok-saghyz]
MVKGWRFESVTSKARMRRMEKAVGRARKPKSQMKQGVMHTDARFTSDCLSRWLEHSSSLWEVIGSILLACMRYTPVFPSQRFMGEGCRVRSASDALKPH